ncbi:unnamed protein product [Urochloa decumbens]|uniref:Disease resistance protein At4g27190-like leucine-rich repeats domain-containing protein n=1 Tax=Urochloa decumbens TaxID=240449 RepID=A0ABC9FPX2_9POAL
MSGFLLYLVDTLVNEKRKWSVIVSFKRRGRTRVDEWQVVPVLEEKVAEWSMEHPVIWNVGIGPGGSFVWTLSRLLFDRTKELYEPFDHITHVRLPTIAAASSSASQHWLALGVLTEIVRTLEIPPPNDSNPEELMQLAAEEAYYGYGTISDYLMAKVFGWQYIKYFGSDPLSIKFDTTFYGQHRHVYSTFRDALKEKTKHLLLVENLQVPISLDVLVFIMGMQWPSPFHSRWLISTTSNDVFHKSREARPVLSWETHLTEEYYHAPPFNDLGGDREWAMLLKEALRDAAASIHNTLQQEGRDFEFWLRVAQHCLYYGILFHPLRITVYHPQLQDAAEAQATSNISSVTSDELVRCWVAEDLLFSTTSPTSKPATTGKKKSNYYRSAYEAGKVVIKALQQYSLLPIYSASTPTNSASWTATTSASSSSQDAVTGVSKLAEDVDVPQIRKWSEKLRWVSYMNGFGRHVSWDWSQDRKAKLIPGEMTTSTLVLRCCSNISAFPMDKVLNRHLRVLDLSYTPIDSLPPGFSQLLNLHLLSLRGCSLLKTLSPSPRAYEEENSPLAYLGNLQVLDMNGVPLLEITQHDGSNKSNLHYLDLSGSRIITLPSQFFHGMSSLEELILGNCFNLKELPPSGAGLSNLLVLHVEGTQITCFPDDMFEEMQRLHTLNLIDNMLLLSLPRSMSKAKVLKELHIDNCNSLRPDFLLELASCLEDLYIQEWEALEYVLIQGHPNLRTFSLSGPSIKSLSLRGCSSLKIVNFNDDLTALEDVDLSGTAIEELVRFPKIFYLDQHADDDNQFSKMFCQQKICEDGNAHREKTINTAHININDPRMFHSFSSDAANKLVTEGQFLQCFNVQVSPVSQDTVLKKKRVRYVQRSSGNRLILVVHSSDAASIVHMMKLQPKQRHVEISANNRYPDGLRHLLSVTMSIFIRDDRFVRSLTELNYIMMSLEECQLMHCHEMEVVFRMPKNGTGVTYLDMDYGEIQLPEVFPSLRLLQVSNLNNLLSLVEQDMTFCELITLKLLKHIHLEHCPRVEKIFPCSLSLPALETLVVLFCSNLKTIFYEQLYSKVAPSPFPNIKKIYLQELPQLQHIHDDDMFRFETPKWEKLFVRGCQSLQCLPLLKKEFPNSKVEVSAEREWWDGLQLRLPEQNDHYVYVPPPEFASLKKHIIKSYLR